MCISIFCSKQFKLHSQDDCDNTVLIFRCYGRALKIIPDSAPLWHDLGIGFFYLCKEKSSEAERKSLIDRCMHALKKSLSLDPSNHMHWTALGVVAASQCEQRYFTPR